MLATIAISYVEHSYTIEAERLYEITFKAGKVLIKERVSLIV